MAASLGSNLSLAEWAASPAPRTAIFYASQAAAARALPSFAVLMSRAAPGGNGGVALRPQFAADTQRQQIRVAIPAGTSLYGLGEAAGPLRRNGRTLVLWNTDAYGYDDRSPSLYQTHPWVLGLKADGKAFGLLFDSTYRQTVTLPSLAGGDLVVEADGPSFPVWVIERDSPQAVVRTLADLTGHMPLPPEWALGYQQCRWSYYPAARVEAVAAEFRRRRIPCDTIWMDIDYMDGYRIFTFDAVQFPDPSALNRRLHDEGFHTVWMIDPGLKSGADERPDPGNPEQRERQRSHFAAIRSSGLAGGHFVLTARGTTYTGEVWPGQCYFPDFTRAATRAWWGSLYRDFIAQGVDGVWNDMNEPAIFHVSSKTMPEDNLHRADSDLGGPGPHARYHNVFGMLMVRATREGILAARPQLRPFVLSRANYLGGQRYAAAWTGDNSADWRHLNWSIPMTLNLGLSGQPFAGPDIGGFATNGPDDPAERGRQFAVWMGIGSLLPFSRAHTAKGNIDKEPWAFGPEVEASCRRAIERRYRLLPYLYTVFQSASVTGLPVARPLFFADPSDPALRGIDDEFLLGDDLLVVAPAASGRKGPPTLPRGGWTRFIFPGEAVDPYLPLLYLRPGRIVPLGPLVQFVGEKPLDPLTLAVCLDSRGQAQGSLYEDAGDGFGYQKGEASITDFTAVKSGGSLALRTQRKGGFAPPLRRTETIEIRDERP